MHCYYQGSVKIEKMMPQVDEVAEGTYRIETRISGFHILFTIYFIKDNGGALIEPGPAALVPTIQAVIKNLKIDHLEYIIPTHIHLDHAGALGELAQLFPEAKVVVNPEGARHVINPSRLIQSTRMAFGEDFEAVFGAILPVPKPQTKISDDGERLPLGSRELVIIHTPGHAPHHVVVFDTKTKGLFCGEALGLIYTPGSPPLPAVTAPSFDAEAYLANMERLKTLKPLLLFYSHGGIGKEPDNLITSAINNTRVIGGAILDALRAQQTEETIIRNIGDYIWNRFKVRLEQWDLVSNVKGYIYYFKKQGDLWPKPIG
jgi:glyoxylase-like metal-dependent hydrolase (beta-lactamase superfamily II)